MSKAQTHRKNSGLYYWPKFISAQDREQIMNYLLGLYPIWEERYSNNNPPPSGKTQRYLLRPTYWLGNWQFAGLGYYHPPKGILYRSIRAETYPEVLAKAVQKIEAFVHEHFSTKDIPQGWRLNTCLINYYGERIENGKSIEAGRVGEHKDFEPGPIGSISFGERALIQFVRSSNPNSQSQVIEQQWLEDSSLQVFGGDRYKRQLFHRVQRVENKLALHEDFNAKNYITRRINFTFRFVPEDHIIPLAKLPENIYDDIKVYVSQLAQNSQFWKDAMDARK